MNAQVMKMQPFPDPRMSCSVGVGGLRAGMCNSWMSYSLADEAGSWMMGTRGRAEEGAAWEKRGVVVPVVVGGVCENLEVVDFPRIFSDEAMEPVPPGSIQSDTPSPAASLSQLLSPSVIPHAAAAAFNHSIYTSQSTRRLRL